jgi:hypothetical protein
VFWGLKIAPGLS